MNYQTDIAPLETAGLTDSQIADVLSTLTVRPVPFGELVNFLDDEGLANRHPISLQWEGVLPTIAVTDGHPLQAGIAKLFSHLNKPQSIHIDTTQQPWCLMAAQLLAGLVQIGVITEQHREAFYALGGGLKHGVVTPQDVADSRAAGLLLQERQSAVDAITQRTNEANAAAAVAFDAGLSAAEITAAAEAAWAGS